MRANEPLNARQLRVSGILDHLLRIDDLVNEAMQKNHAIQRALRGVKALRHRVPQVKTLSDPTVSVGWAGNITPFSVQQGDPSSYRGASASQAIPYPGKLKIRGEIADREAEAADFGTLIRAKPERRELVGLESESGVIRTDSPGV